MDIRKISVGPDYKSGAMHYLVGQNVLNGAYKIHLIKYDSVLQSCKIYIEEDDVIVTMTHFDRALKEMKPTFGNRSVDIENLIPDKFEFSKSPNDTCAQTYKDIMEYMSTNRKTNDDLE